MQDRAIVVETFDHVEVVALLPPGAPDPSPAYLRQLAASYIAQPDWHGESSGVATARVVEDLRLFRHSQLTAEQQQALAGL